MRRFILGSLILHVAIVLVGGFLLCPWAEQACPRASHAVIDVDVIRIGKRPASGSARLLPRSEKLSAIQKSETKQIPELATDAENSPPSNVVRISKEEGGSGLDLTIEDYMHWVVQHNKAPIYPRLAQLRGEEGRAILEISVAREGGRLQDVKVVQSSGSDLLDEVSLAAVKDWRFAKFEAQEASIRFRVPFRFALK